MYYKDGNNGGIFGKSISNDLLNIHKNAESRIDRIGSLFSVEDEIIGSVIRDYLINNADASGGKRTEGIWKLLGINPRSGNPRVATDSHSKRDG